MRIQDRNTLGTTANEAGRAHETQKSDRDEAARSGAAPSAASGDRVELSSTLGHIANAISSYSAQRSSRVEALAADYEHGRFHPDPAATSRAMISEALGQAMH